MSNKGLSRGGPRTIWISDNVKYLDYGYPDEDEPDPTKYPKGPFGRPIAGSKRVARHREQGSALTSGQNTTANPALAPSNSEVCLYAPLVYSYSCCCIFFLCFVDFYYYY